MIRTILLTIAVFLSSLNLANAQSKHVRDIQKINAALPTAKLSKAQRAKVIRLRNKGAREHYSGNHQAAQVDLENAKAILHIH